jgi:cellulose synthase/poly-beta-1,6-N-acetylglucosamine synthase-like glycosyltransferase
VLLVWVPIGLLAWVYAGYPILALALGRLRPMHLREDDPPPSLTVAIAVHDEAGVVAERIADAFAQDANGARIAEVIVGSDGSTDGTDEIVRKLAASEPRLKLVQLARSGQTPTQHALFAAATGDVVVLTDAETRFGDGCLEALARAMQDRRVGCATGRLEWRNEDATATSANESLYWRYERWVRAAESEAGLLTAVTGALLAVRRSAYRPVAAAASMDHLLPLYVREAGGEVIYVPTAVATDRPISGLREQFRNRSRTASRGIRSNLSMARRLAPWRHGRAALAIWSHKILRWATPWLVLWATVGATVIGTSDDPGYLLVPAAGLVGGAAAVVGQAMAGGGLRPPRALAFARAFAVVNLAFARGWIDVARGRRIEAWHSGRVALDR